MNGSTASFLYVEDDPLSRQVMQMIMRNTLQDYSLNIFEDSQDFLTRLYGLDPYPTVILADVYVQPYNGFDMLRMVREDPTFSMTRVIALTASVMNEEVEQLRSSGFDGAIGKPISVTTFPGLIERILHGEAVWHIA